jgi:ABC-2 type transport system permease protein
MAFCIQVIGMFLNNVIFLFFWWVILKRLPSVNGWTLPMIASIFSFLVISVGIASIVFGNYGAIASSIINGGLDYYMTLPANLLLHLLISKSSFTAWGEILSGLVIFLSGVPNGITKIPLLFAFSLIGVFIIVGFGMLIGSLPFYIRFSSDISGYFFNALTTFSLYPIDIFPSFVKIILYFLIPSAMISSVPALLIFKFSWIKLLGLLAFALIITLTGGFLFVKGLRRYESGNLVNIRD